MHRYTLSYFVDSIVVLLLFACLLYSHEYDKCGRVTRITHDYDNMGLPVEERCNEHKILRTYDRLGQIATLTSSLGANLTYERNEFGELLNFKARQGDTENHFVSEHQYDSLGL